LGTVAELVALSVETVGEDIVEMRAVEVVRLIAFDYDAFVGALESIDAGTGP